MKAGKLLVLSTLLYNNITLSWYSIVPINYEISKVTIQCPKCNSNDRIQKVSSIYNSGTVNIEGGNIGRATSQSSLANHLRPPEPPSGLKIWYIIPIFLNLAMLLAPINKNDKILIFGCFCLLFVKPLILIGAIGPYILYYRALSKAHQKILKEQTLVYQEAMLKWQKTYYCHRDDHIFYP